MTSKKIYIYNDNNNNPAQLDLLNKNRRLIDYHETVLTRTGCGLILNNCCLGSGKWNEMRKIERKKDQRDIHTHTEKRPAKNETSIYCRSSIP
jgi:hypothetical protein